MQGRRFVWSQKKVQELAAHFIPAADEVWRLQHRDGPECDLFRIIAEQGHYAGRTTPTDTRQGIYAFTPSGVLLASINNNGADRVARMLQAALAKWNALDDDEKFSNKPLTNHPITLRNEQRYPADGLVLRVSSRDLPRDQVLRPLPGSPPVSKSDDDSQPQRRRSRRSRRNSQWAWNLDYCWLSRAEMRALVPRQQVVDSTTFVPAEITRRIARLHLVDNVRGQVSDFDDDHIRAASLTSTITSIDGHNITLQLAGSTRAIVDAQPDKQNPDGWQNPAFNERGIETTLLGRAIYNAQTDSFTSFTLVAIGSRWGGTRYNNREHDMQPSGIGFLFTLANDDAPVAPASLWKYRW